jgi:formamidopyrimidine-DNA glycosylase
MPELPEVETVRRDLEHALVGATVSGVVVSHKRTVRRQHPEVFVDSLIGRQFVGFDRHGKYLLIDLDDGATVVVHLRMSGALRLETPGDPLVVHTHVQIALADGRELRFVDPRTFGELFVTARADGGLPSELAGIGPDPFTEHVDGPALGAICAGRRAAIKTVLLNQQLIAGIGNIYGDEICYAARIRPTRPAGKLRKGELERLAESTRTVLASAVEHRGSTLVDARYRDLAGEVGSYQDFHAVYGRSGEPCPECGTPIVRRVLGGRSAHYCPSCQH